MHVNKVKIRLNENDSFIKLPLSLEFTNVGLSELIEREFVEAEVEKAINPIVDYEKVRFSPVDDINQPINTVRYKINFLSGQSMLIPTNYSDLGFNNDDIKYRKNNFVKSFLRLSFYDSDVPTNQNLISFVTIFSNIGDDGITPNANAFPVSFVVTNPKKNKYGSSEGYYLYHYKEDVTTDLPKYLFMKAEFNNAKSGKKTNLITINNALSIDSLINNIHMRYILKRTTTGFYYTIDNTYSTNVINSNSAVDVNLYEIQVL